MAVGDVVAANESVNAGSYLDIQPGSGNEWVIHNIYHEDMVELYWYDGTDNLLFDADQTFGVFAWMEFHCTNTYRVRVKNTAATAKLIGYDGIQTKGT